MKPLPPREAGSVCCPSHADEKRNSTMLNEASLRRVADVLATLTEPPPLQAGVFCVFAEGPETRAVW